jgi:hypothetical protein
MDKVYHSNLNEKLPTNNVLHNFALVTIRKVSNVSRFELRSILASPPKKSLQCSILKD